MATAGESTLSPSERQAFASIEKLLHQDPESALESMIPKVEESMKEAGANLRIVHLMRFMAYTNLALKRGSESGRIDVDLIEAALVELRNLFDASQYEETETYQKEIEVRPAGLFRKAQMELRTFTRTVKKSNLDPEVYLRHLNAVAPLVERERPGSVSRILGQISLRCLVVAGHVSSPPLVDINVLDEVDRVRFGDVWLSVDKPVCAAFVVSIEPGRIPRGVVAFLEDSLDRNPNASVVATYKIEKRSGSWIAEVW